MAKLLAEIRVLIQETFFAIFVDSESNADDKILGFPKRIILLKQKALT